MRCLALLSFTVACAPHHIDAGLPDQPLPITVQVADLQGRPGKWVPITQSLQCAIVHDTVRLESTGRDYFYKEVEAGFVVCEYTPPNDAPLNGSSREDYTWQELRGRVSQTVSCEVQLVDHERGDYLRVGCSPEPVDFWQRFRSGYSF